ncbi:MAG: GHKL domain-containing protein [Ruminococcus flavefaciens]|nr:GHKL domain-containing protein [Ruminococcus flavefaciens]MCM1229311.1 GHKL domain-containing protein [Ruminococcus flavefaciens]
MIESLIVAWFVSSYFKANTKFSGWLYIFAVYALILLQITAVSLLDFHWIITAVISSVSLTGILSLFFRGSPPERIIIAFTSIFLLALCDICAFTLIGQLLGINYRELVINSGFSRFLAVMTSKILYIIFCSFILFFKKKYRIFISRRELSLILTTFTLSCIQLSLIRTVIYEQKKYYNVFLLVLLCILVINVILYYTMVYIGKQNADERNLAIMQKQIEFQKESIRSLEQKYDETAKIRHDMKNYISCALRMAEQGKYDELTDYLEELSEEVIDRITSYIRINRSILGAMLNSKIARAKIIQIDMQCYILSELDSISDMDIITLLANLLDNAIEACEKNRGKSEIVLKTWNEAGYYFIEVSNTVESDILADNPDLVTSKKNAKNHGIGLRSVRDIVDNHNGMINFRQTGNIFHVYVSLAKNEENL